MGNRITQPKLNVLKQLTLACLVVICFSGTARAWWKPDWTIRKKITIDTTSTGGAITNPIGTSTVLIRLHDGNFNFSAAKGDGSDIRFLAADEKTELPYQIEAFDNTLDEAFVWVKVPDIKPGAKADIWMYYGNDKADAPKPEDVKKTYEKDTVIVYHFGEKNASPVDASPSGINAANPGTHVDGSVIGSGVRFLGKNVIAIPGAPPLAWIDSGAMTWSAWIKPTDINSKVVLYSRHDGENSFVIGIDTGVPYAEVKGASGPHRTSTGEPLAAGTWRHLAVTADGTKITVYLDGDPYGSVQATLPALKGPALVGGDGAVTVADGNVTPPDPGAISAGFVGEMDELEISNVARPQGFIQFAALSQGTTEKGAKTVAAGNDEASGAHENELTRHISLLSDISKSLTPDGWAVIFLCTLLAIVGWGVSIMKLLYLNRIKKGTDAFLKEWRHLSADLSVLDHSDEENVKSLGGRASPKVQRLMCLSPIYHIYKIGSEEIQNRIDIAQDGFKGLSGRSMQAIRAALDSGLVREVQRLNSKLVFLTIGIAGGPYLGLLGTVIGVMITFAVIAKSGAVEVNSIAPGIAGALLATVAGLAVAIPALFAYSYISTRIKDAVNEMTIFIDEYITKIAEVYPHDNE